MTLAFRNLNITPGDPVDQWGVEGLLAAIERGDITHWRRIARALREQPRGKVSKELAEVLQLVENPAMAVLFGRIQRRVLREAEERERSAVTFRLGQYLGESGLSRAEFAYRLGTSQSRLSTYLNGRVVPSALLMVRAEEIAAGIAAGSAGSAGSAG